MWLRERKQYHSFFGGSFKQTEWTYDHPLVEATLYKSWGDYSLSNELRVGNYIRMSLGPWPTLAQAQKELNLIIETLIELDYDLEELR